jgi:peptide/nickel transport system substrate-binding protein/oligopeptide transport system substrate-binding protein
MTKVRGIALCLAVAAMLCGCAQRTIPPDTLRLRLSGSPTTLDPAFIVDVSGGRIAAKLFNGLVKLNDKGEIVPDVAEHWQVSDDGRTYTFTIRSGVRFSNGREVTASDVESSLKRLLSPTVSSPRCWILAYVAGAEDFAEGKTDSVAGISVADERTITIRLDSPFAPFPYLLTMPNAAIVPEEEVDRWGADFGFHPVGTGPFSLADWEQDVRLVLDANSSYYEGVPRVKHVEYIIIPEDLTSVVEFENENLDVLEIPAAEVSHYVRSKRWGEFVVSRTGLNTYYLGFNCQKEPFNDVRVRRAVSRAIDARKIAEKVLEGRVEPATGPIPPGLVEPPPLTEEHNYDPQSAIALLKEAGFESGLKTELMLSTGREELGVCEAIQSYLNELGIEAALVPLEWSAFKKAVASGEAPLFYMSWWADYPEAENFLFPTFHSSNWGAAGNRVRFASQAVDRAIERARGILDQRARAHEYRRIEKMIIDQAPWVFLWHRKEFYIRQPRVGGFKLFPVYSADKGTEIFLTP